MVFLTFDCVYFDGSILHNMEYYCGSLSGIFSGFFDLFMTIMLLMYRILSSPILLFDWLRNCLMDFFVVFFIDRHAHVLSLISTYNDALFRIAVAVFILAILLHSPSDTY